MTREEDFEEQGKITLNDYIRELNDYDFGEASMISMFVFGAHYADQHPREGLWGAEKVEKVLGNLLFNKEEKIYRAYLDYDAFFEDLHKAMED